MLLKMCLAKHLDSIWSRKVNSFNFTRRKSRVKNCVKLAVLSRRMSSLQFSPAINYITAGWSQL